MRFFLTIQPSLALFLPVQHYMLPSSSTLLTCSAKATQATMGPGTGPPHFLLGPGPWARAPGFLVVKAGSLGCLS